MPGAPQHRLIRILTYNVHSCRGTDGKVDPTRVAAVIASCNADIVALQEVDVGRARSSGVDQAERIASHLGMTSHFHPALYLENEQYGDAILTAFPAELVKAAPLPSIGEPRGAIWLSVDIGGVKLQVINTHLGLRRRERLIQATTLLGPEWVGAMEDRHAPAVLMGDFNATPSSTAYRALAVHGQDVQLAIGGRARATFPSRFPFLRLDHIFVGHGVETVHVEVRRDALARRASDHLPLLADIAVAMPTEPRETKSPRAGLMWPRGDRHD